MYTDKDYARFLTKIRQIDGGHWEWTASIQKFGYGSFWAQGRNMGAHVFSWEWHNKRKLPYKMVIRHTCDWPACVAPEHLIVGTYAENSQDMWVRGRGSFQRQNPAQAPSWDLRGENHPLARLTEREVLDIRARYAVGDISQLDLSKKYGVSAATISHAITGRNWNYLPGKITTRRKYIPVQGSTHGNSKLTEEIVVEMRRLRIEGALVKDIAAKFGIDFGHCKSICAGRAWKHVPMPDSPHTKKINQYV